MGLGFDGLGPAGAGSGMICPWPWLVIRLTAGATSVPLLVP